jgi:hypothetical protein
MSSTDIVHISLEVYLKTSHVQTHTINEDCARCCTTSSALEDSTLVLCLCPDVLNIPLTFMASIVSKTAHVQTMEVSPGCILFVKRKEPYLITNVEQRTRVKPRCLISNIEFVCSLFDCSALDIAAKSSLMPIVQGR